jgi:phosphoserine aminotransferase
VDSWQVDEQGAYLHITVNETVNGVEFHWLPESGQLPLVGDMTSMILSRPMDVRRFGLIYASAQKNLGIAGITVVIVRRDLLSKSQPGTPSMLDYRAHLEANLLQNTPPVFAWYVSGKMLAWTKRQGGVAAMAERSRRKAELLYATVDRSGFYVNRVERASRSWMNVPFWLRDAKLESEFLQQAEAAGLVNLVGHRSTGGMRASIYNSMPEEGVQALVDFMTDFERRRG